MLRSRLPDDYLTYLEQNHFLTFLMNLVFCLLFSLDSPRKEVYFMAVIDILQHYDAKKKAAHAAKTVKHGVSVLIITCYCDSSCCIRLDLYSTGKKKKKKDYIGGLITFTRCFPRLEQRSRP